MPVERDDLAYKHPCDKAKAIIGEKVLDGDCNHLCTSCGDWVSIETASPDDFVAAVCGLCFGSIWPADYVAFFRKPHCVAH